MNLELKDTYTTQEILESSKFAELMRVQIAEIRSSRRKFMDEHHTKRIKRTAFDTLEELDMLYPNRLAIQYTLMMGKQSVLSLREREYINDLVTFVVQKTLQWTIEMRKKAEAEADKRLKEIGAECAAQEFEDAPKPRKLRAKKQPKNNETSASDV